MSFFHLCALHSVLWKFLWFFLDLKFDIFPPWSNTWKHYLGFAFIQGWKMSIFELRKKRENSLLIVLLFTEPIILAKGMIWYNDCKTFKTFLKNAGNLWHQHSYQVAQTRETVEYLDRKEFVIEKQSLLQVSPYWIMIVNPIMRIGQKLRGILYFIVLWPLNRSSNH